jgi:hypothetical protein
MISPVYKNYLFSAQSQQASPAEMQVNVQNKPGGETLAIGGPSPSEKNKAIGPKECKT